MSKSILVVDDEPEIRELLTNRLTSLNYDVETAANGVEALKCVDEQQPDLIILDISMPEMDGYTFIQELKKKSFDSKLIPILILSAKDSLQDVFQVEGIHDYLVKPFDSNVLHDKIVEIFNRIDRKKVLIVDDDPDILELLENRLRANHFEVIKTNNGASCIELVDRMKPDLLIIDIMLPGILGTTVCKTLKNEERYAQMPIIIVSAKSKSYLQSISNIDFQEDAYFVKPFNSEELLATIKQNLEN